MWNLLNLLNVPLSLFQNLYNARTVRANNAHQSMLVDKQNKAAEMQAEKAYRRSLPSNQIAQMRSAGISDFGAAQAISGGATYNPAPVNTANTDAPQMDLSGAMQALSTSAQLKQEMKMQDKQLAATEAAQKAQFNENEKQREHELLLKDIDTANQTQHDYLEYQKHVERLNHDANDLQLRRDSFEYGKKVLDSQVELSNAQKDRIRAELDEWSKEPFVSARENLARLESLAAIYNYHIKESDFYKYLQDHYTYDEDTGTWKSIYDPKIYSSVGAFNKVDNMATSFWSCVLSIFPVTSVLKSMKLFGNNEKK